MQWPLSLFRRKAIILEDLEPGSHDQPNIPSKPINKPLRSKEIVWAEGIRGLAALGVLGSHLTLCFANFLRSPCCAPGSEWPHLFQLPIFRLITAGEAMVACFLVLTGFTAAYKPLSLARKGEYEKAYSGVAVSSFRRIPRLFLPATVATVFSWAMCNVGGYEMAHQGDAWWLIVLTPNKSVGPWYQAFIDIYHAIWVAWMPYGVSPYDQPQWALQFFVEAGFMVFLAVLGTARLRTFWRVVVLCLWARWSGYLSVATRDPFVGYCTLLGMVIGEMNLIVTERKWHKKLVGQCVGGVIIFLGLCAMSYPPDWRERSAWSKFMTESGPYVLPHNDDKVKPWVSLGCLVLFFGCTLSSWAQRVLSLPPLVWLGKLSFAIYLLHGVFVRSLWAWVAFAGQKEKVPSKFNPQDMRYPLPSNGWLFFSVVCTVIPLLITCHLWCMFLEPQFDRITLALESLMLGTLAKNNPNGWIAKIMALGNILWFTATNGRLPPHQEFAGSIDLESEGLLRNSSAEYTPSRLYAMTEIVHASPKPYRDSPEGSETDSEQSSSSKGKLVTVTEENK